MMVQFGQQITRAGDPLQVISMERLFAGIREPRESFKNKILTLRELYLRDPEEYHELKKQLPYFVCGRFQPPVRKKTCFVDIEFFIIDLDHLSANFIDKDDLLEHCKGIPEVMMAFCSPGADGLKLLFRLEEKCEDEALFSAFYKQFALTFSQKYQLEGVIDTQTSDVTRACFMSYDPEAWYRPEALPVDWRKQVQGTEKKDEVVIVGVTGDAEKTLLEQIRGKLDSGKKKPRPVQHHVPPEVDEALVNLQEKLQSYGLEIVDATAIQYGRKLRISTGKMWAEVNVFYGAKGFSVVKTNKSGSNAELAMLAEEVMVRELVG